MANDYPKWVQADQSWVDKKDAQPANFFTANHVVDHAAKTPPLIVIHDFEQFHVTRDGRVMVLVKDASGEAKAKNPKS